MNIKLNIYDYMIIVLCALTILGMQSFGVSETLPQVVISVTVAVGLDFIIKYWKTKGKILSKSAIITGLFVATILDLGHPLWVPAIVSTVAILSKHLIRYKNRHVFNPANFGLLFALLLGVSHSWWSSVNLYATVILGLLIVWQFQRFKLVISFLVVHFLLLGVVMFATNNIAAVYSHFTNGLLYFFTFLMLIEPKTSPFRENDRIYYGALTGVLSVLFIFVYPGASHNLALVFGNIFAFYRNVK